MGETIRNKVTVAITGHREDKLDLEDQTWIMSAIGSSLEFLEADRMIQGMANGVDLWSAVVAKGLEVPYMAARPWAGHLPRASDIKLYKWALDNATKIEVVNPAQTYPGPWVYDERNQFMVDRSTHVLAVWDGSPGGTGNCVKYAIKHNSPIYRINPLTKEVGWYRRPIQESELATQEDLH